MITSAAPPDVGRMARELLARVSWSTEQLAAHQQQHLRATVRHALEASPYYRRALGSDALDAPLAELPTLSKTTLMERFDEIVTDPRLRRDALAEHLAGPHASEPYKEYLALTTSGTTGERGNFVYPSEQLAAGVAGLVRAMVLLGVTPSTRIVGIGAPSAVHVSRHLVAGLMARRQADAPRLSVLTPLPDLVAALNSYQPEAFPTNASVAALLAEEQLAGRLHISPRIVACTSEVLTDDMRSRMRAAWGIEPHQLYATTEAAVIASSSAANVGLHAWEDLTLLEVVDAHNRPVPAGTTGHKLLLTNLVNRTQPLIRYELSDSVTLAIDDDPTGWPFRRIANVDGRSDDIIELPARQGGTIAIHPALLRAPFATFPEVVQYQVIHCAGRLTVRIVTRPETSLDVHARVRSAIARQLVAAGALTPPITVSAVSRIEPDPGPGGKIAVVKARCTSA
jgi:phenylacetate-CoA ligase